MLFKKKNQNQIKDERIEKETNKIMPAVFAIFTLGLLASFITKLVLGEPWYNFILEILCLVPSWGYAVIKRAKNGILFLKEKDDALLTIRNEIMSKAYMIAFRILTTGQLVYLFFVEAVLMPEELSWIREMTWLVVYLGVDFVTALIVTVFTIKKGWLIWGSKKREVAGKKNFAKRTAVGALFFGVCMGFFDVLENGFSMQTVTLTLGTGAMWGILFYFSMLAVIKVSEKNADKAVKEQEGADEE